MGPGRAGTIRVIPTFVDTDVIRPADRLTPYRTELEIGDEPVVLFGHDWGAPISSHTAIRHPDRVRAVANLSVPHYLPGGGDPIAMFDAAWGDSIEAFAEGVIPAVTS